MNEESPIRSLVNRLKLFVSSEKLPGRLYADLTDILEVCDWFASAIGTAGKEPLTRDELEDLLVDLDVHMQHLAYHLDSLRKDLPVVLDAIGLPEDKGPE